MSSEEWHEKIFLFLPAAVAQRMAGFTPGGLNEFFVFPQKDATVMTYVHSRMFM